MLVGGDKSQAFHGQCREKRSQALQRCNLTKDISVDSAAMVLPVPDGAAFVGDSFPKADWTPEPSLVCTKDSHKLFPGHPECFH